MKKAFTTHGLIFQDKDNVIIISNSQNPIEIEVPEETYLILSEKTYITPDFVNHKQIEVQIGWLCNDVDPDDIKDVSSYFEIDVHIEENEDPICEVKNRNFKLEDLSMELQARIIKVANEMYVDKMKTIVND